MSPYWLQDFIFNLVFKAGCVVALVMVLAGFAAWRAAHG